MDNSYISPELFRQIMGDEQSRRNYPEEILNRDDSAWAMSPDIDANTLQKIAQNVQANINIQKNITPNASVISGGGRVGYPFETDGGLFNIGLTGGGAIGETRGNQPKQTFSNFNVTGGDIGYSQGDNSYSVQYQKSPEMGYLIKLLYSRQF